MIISLPVKASAAFHYQMLPSSFQLAEAPTYRAWQIFQSSEKLWDQEASDFSQCLINRTLAVLAGVGGYLGGIIALPLTLASIPVTIVADVVIGLAECSFCYYHGLSGNDIKKIAHRKFIASPLQQLVFCSAAISTMAVANFIFLGGCFLSISNPYLVPFVLSIFWTIGYAFGQAAVGKLPSHLNHQSFNIFINGGSGEIEGTRWVDEGDVPLRESFNGNPEDSSTWGNYLVKERGNLSPVDDAGAHEKYIAFKKGIFEQQTPQQLLGLNDGFTERELKIAYRTIASILHPDKNGSSRESTSLFKILNEACQRLSQNFPISSMANSH